jgi:hypothetical protein
MNDYGGLSRAVREELEQRNENEKLELLSKQTPTTEPADESFWQRLRESIILLTNKAPK